MGNSPIPGVRGIHRSPVNSPNKGQWRWALMFSLICVWINGWVNNREAGDLRRYRAHHDVTLMKHGGWHPVWSHEGLGLVRSQPLYPMRVYVCLLVGGCPLQGCAWLALPAENLQSYIKRRPLCAVKNKAAKCHRPRSNTAPCATAKHTHLGSHQKTRSIQAHISRVVGARLLYPKPGAPLAAASAPQRHPKAGQPAQTSERWLDG